VRVARRVRRAGRGNPPGAILAGRPGPTQLAAAARPAVAPAPRTRRCHTGTRACPRPEDRLPPAPAGLPAIPFYPRNQEAGNDPP